MNIGDVLDAITQVMAANRIIYVPTALTWLRGLLLIVFVWTVARMAIQKRGFDHYPFLFLLLHYLVLFTVLTNWADATALVTDEIRFLRNLVEHGQETQIFTAVTGITTQVRSARPLLPSVSDWITIGVIEIVLSIFEAAVYFVLTFGFIASAICQIVGPLFVGLSIVPGLGWMLSGWIRSFIGYSLYPLFGALYCDIVAQVLTFFVQAHPPPWSSVDLGLMSAGFVMLAVGLCGGVWQVPKLVQILSGHVGASAVPNFILRRF
jgi:hypothetical protein